MLYHIHTYLADLTSFAIVGVDRWSLLHPSLLAEPWWFGEAIADVQLDDESGHCQLTLRKANQCM